MSASTAVLNVRDVSLSRGNRRILERAAFEAFPGEVVAVMGPSGSGKTTLLRAIVGIEGFQQGQIDVGGVTIEGRQPLSRQTARALCRRVGMVFQFHCLFEHLSAVDNVCLAPVHAYRIAPAAARQRALELLKSFGVEHRADALPRHLSGGEAQRVAIARALAVDPPLLLMDEPTASLDPARRAELGQLIRGLVSKGRTLVITTHDEDFARQWATRRLRIENGAVVT